MGVPNEQGCIFCSIVRKDSPAALVHEDQETLAFLDLFPLTRGHLLVVPRRHVDRLTDLPEGEYPGLLRAVSAVCRKVERLSTHYNVSMNQGALAGQIVFHLHVHVIPRYEGDNAFGRRPRERLSETEAAALLKELG
ncbi:MAG: HIT family protein [Thermoplasmata archaeon]|nr:HIT family protein [Thermoplasmata archaeon]